jgi:putative ABC transport system substrate-binding protein
LTEGRNITIEYLWAEGTSDRAAELAAEFVRLKVNLIVTWANPMVLAAKRTTLAIPIVFAAAADPLGTGLVAALAQPGGNVTGLSVESTDLGGKRLEFSRELSPGLRRLAIMADVDNSASVLEIKLGIAPMHFMSVSTLSYSRIGYSLTTQHLPNAYRRCFLPGKLSKREVL